MVFESLHKDVQKALKERGFESPTEAQKLAIPEILSGHNILLIAPTGIGKTESGLLPIFSRMVENRQWKPISVLYITPLRSLNRDLETRILWWANNLDFEVGVRHGDTTQYERSKQSGSPPNLLISTPESIQSMLTGAKIREHFKNLKYVVVDEIHELADSKRGVQLSIALERLREYNPDFQLIGLSATLGSPNEVAQFLAGGRPVKVLKAITSKELDITINSPQPNEDDKELAERLYISPTIAARIHLVKKIIESHRSSLVFTNTRDFAEILSSRLRQMEKAFEHDIHHSSLSKEVRIKAEQDFKSEKLKAIIATSSLELGIDIGAIDVVIQYMSPRQVSKLLQRVGRAGHKFNKISKGIVVAGDPDDIFEATAITNLSLQGKIEKLQIHKGAWDVLVNQIAAMSLETYDLPISKAYEIVKRSYCYHDLKLEDFKRLINEMVSLRLIFADDKIRRKLTTREFYYRNLSMIPDTNSYKIVNNLDDSYVGSLDEDFVALNGEPGKTFIVKGRPWKIVGVFENKVKVEPVEDIEASVPGWEGEMIPVPYEVAQEVGRLRRDILELSKKEDGQKQIQTKYHLSQDAANSVTQYMKEQEKFFIPDDKTLVFEKYQDALVVHTCFGSLVNESLARILTTMLSNYYGSVSLRIDPYRIIIQMPEIGDRVKEILKDVRPHEVENLIRISMDKTEFFKVKFLKIAKKWGAIRPHLDYTKLNMRRVIKSFEGTLLYEETLREIMTEKMDIESTKKVLTEIQNGKLKILFKDGLSPIGAATLKSQAREIVTQDRPEKEIFEIFKERLLNTEIRLLCMNCNNLSVTQRVRDIQDEPECRACGSRLVASVRPHHTELAKLHKKYVSKKVLNGKETEEIERLKRSSDIIIVYGKKALLAQAGRGLGPQTAARVLSKMRKTEQEFMEDILEEERRFARTRRFWS